MNCLKCVTGTYVADTSDMACILANSLPSLSITSPSNIPHLNDLYPDLNMPLVFIVLMIFIVVITTSTSVY